VPFRDVIHRPEVAVPFAKRIVAVIVVLVLAACGGGGGSSGSPLPLTGSPAGGGNSGSTSSARESVQLNMHIPGGAGTASSIKRKPQFVASSTQGVLVVVYATSDTAHANPLGTSATNVAPGSAACGGASGPRTCSVSIPAPPGTDDFVFTTYDQPPNSGTTFPSNANLLAAGTVTGKTISSASANVVNVTLGGAVSQTQANPYNYNVLAGIGPETYALEITALDADGNTIIGPYLDANGNPDPVTVSVVESGGSGFTKVSVGGATPTSSTVVNGSSDIVTVSYSGGGTIGYGVVFSANAATGQPLSPTFGPMFVTSTSPAFTPALGPNTPAALNLTSPNESATLSIGETNPYGPAVFYPNNCAGIVTATTPSSGAVESLTLTASSAGGSCSASIGFNFANYILNINAVGNTTATVAVPGTTLAYLPQGAGGVVILTESGATVETIATSSSADGVALDDAGNLYVETNPTSSNTVAGSITEYTPSGSAFPPTYTKLNKTYTITDPDHLSFIQADGAGDLMALEYGSGTTPVSSYDVWKAGASGAPTFTVTHSGYNGGYLFFGGVDHAGNVYTAYYTTCDTVNTCLKYDVHNASTGALERTISETIVPDANQSSFSPNYMAVGPDGTLYVTEWTFLSPDPYQGLYIYPPSGPERSFTALSGPDGVDLDGVGNVYVVNNNSVYNTGSPTLDTSHLVVELSPGGSTPIRSLTIPAGAAPITVSSDGTAFISVFPQTGLNLAVGTYRFTSSQYNVNEISSIAASDVVLWDGSRTTLSRARAPLSLGSGSAHSSGFRAFHR
jgi:hypothetical protein